MTDPMSKQNFEKFLKQPFSVSLNGEQATLELAEIVVPERTPPHYECFSLLFKGYEQIFLEQAIYSFQAEGFEPLELFLVPVAGDQTGYDYEVIINRKIEA